MLDAVLMLLSLLLLADTLRWHAILARGIDRQRATAAAIPPELPSMTVIRPVKGADPDQLENFTAALAQSYPGPLDTIFVFDDPSDPGVPNAERAIAEMPGAAARILYSGEPPAGWTGKLHAMHLAAGEATGELIAFGDSDTRPAASLTAALAARLLAEPAIGCTFAPAVVTGRARTAGDVGYALLLNSLYGPVAARASGKTGDLPFIMGQIMVFRRAALDAVGGVACARGRLVDDMAIGEHLHAAGWRNVMVAERLDIVAHGMGFADFVRTYRRWLMFGRDGLGIAFTWPVWVRSAEFFLALVVAALAGLAGLVGSWPAAGIALLAAVTFGWSLTSLHRRIGGSPMPVRYGWMTWGLLLLAPVIVVSTWFGTVDWRGRSYSVRREGLTG